MPTAALCNSYDMEESSSLLYNISMVQFIGTTIASVYIIFAALVFGCGAALAVLVLVFGLRAKRNVKKETVTKLADGFSPLDIKRIFIGKTYPRRLTRALIVHWANRGYIDIKYVSRYTVRVTKKADMPPHDSEDAVFYDRGTYVRELELFKNFVKKIRHNATVDIRKSLFTKQEATAACNGFAVREDDGVYSAKHYTLKIISIIISVAPFALTTVWTGIDTGNFMGIMLFFMALIGLSVLKFAQDMPILFKLLWCGMWLGCSIGGFLSFAFQAYDPCGIAIIAAVLTLIGPMFIIRFIDYRERANLDDYSDLVNYRKFLLYAQRSELNKQDYYKALPFIYAFNLKPFVKHRFERRACPDWYKNDIEGKGALV